MEREAEIFRANLEAKRTRVGSRGAECHCILKSHFAGTYVNKCVFYKLRYISITILLLLLALFN